MKQLVSFSYLRTLNGSALEHINCMVAEVQGMSLDDHFQSLLVVCARVTCSSCSRAYLPSVFFRFIALAQPSIIQTFSYVIIAVQTARPWVMQFLVPEKTCIMRLVTPCKIRVA